MGKVKKTSRMRLYRIISQNFILLFSIFLLFRFHISHEFMWVATIVLILMTIVLRTGFCGWLCPLGATADVFRAFGKKVGSLGFMKPVNKKYRKWVRNNQSLLYKLDRYARYFKYFFLLWIVQAALFDIASISSGGIILVLFSLIYIVVILLAFLTERAWCKYLCPVGATLGIISIFSPTKVARNEQACISCKLCTKSCPMNIDVANMTQVNDTECITCLKCVDACPVEDALDLNVNLPFAEGKEVIQTSEIINK